METERKVAPQSRDTTQRQEKELTERPEGKKMRGKKRNWVRLISSFTSPIPNQGRLPPADSERPQISNRLTPQRRGKNAAQLRRQQRVRLWAVPFAPLAYLAHPLALAWLLGAAAYLADTEQLRGKAMR